VVAVMAEVAVVADGSVERNDDGWEIDPRTLAWLIKSTRQRLGISQIEVAARGNFDQKIVSNIETLRTRRAPSPRVVRGLQVALGIPETQILKALGYLADEPAEAESEVEAVYTAWAQQVATHDGIGDLERRAILDAINLARRIRESERG
jgi:transcriptional regulator with XRE-family HTH domain